MKAMIFLAGTSQVGKTEYFNAFPENLNGRRVLKEGMAARDIRASIGNPTWEQLSIDRQLMFNQQKLIMDTYIQRIGRMKERLENDDGDIALFERSPYDVIGYTYAFLRKSGWSEPSGDTFNILTDQTQIIDVLMKELSQEYYILNAFEVIRHEIPYDVQNGARPSIDIRMLCEEYLNHWVNLFDRAPNRSYWTPANIDDTLRKYETPRRFGASLNHGFSRMDEIAEQFFKPK